MAEGCQTCSMGGHQQVFCPFFNFSASLFFDLFFLLFYFFAFVPLRYLVQADEQLGGETRDEGENSKENLNSFS